MNTYTENCPRNVAVDSVGVFANLLHALRDTLANQQLKRRIHQERRQLLTMSEAMLKDIGIDRVQAEQEAIRIDIPQTRVEVQARKIC